MKRLLKRWINDHQAVAAIEFALVSPVLLLLMGGVVEFGRAFQVYEAVNQLTSQYAIAYADCNESSTCSTELVSSTSQANYVNQNAIQNIVPQLTYSKLSLQMFQVSMSTSTPYAVTVQNSYPSGSTLTTAQTTAIQTALTAAAQSARNNINNPQVCIYGILVTAAYTHSLAYFPTLMTPFLGSYLTPSSTVIQLQSVLCAS